MATMVCRGPQPCVDSQFIETTWPRLKLTSHLPHSLQFAFNSCFLDIDSSKTRHECEGLNQILINHSVTNSAPAPPPPPSHHACKKSDFVPAEAKSVIATKEIQSDYVHPLVKRSRSTLSDKSLALCTENLGNETGTDFVQDAIFSDLKVEPSPTRKRVKSNNNQGSKKLFPPPLTTIAGVDSIRVRSHREDGRLIMEAVQTPARLSYFHVERSQGRLRLSILKSSTSSTENEKEKEIRNDGVEAVGEKGNCEEEMGGKVEENGNLGGAEIEIEKLERPRRCKCKQAVENNNNNNNNNIDEIKNNNVTLTREPLSIWVSS